VTALLLELGGRHRTDTRRLDDTARCNVGFRRQSRAACRTVYDATLFTRRYRQPRRADSRHRLALRLGDCSAAAGERDDLPRGLPCRVALLPADTSFAAAG